MTKSLKRVERKNKKENILKNAGKNKEKTMKPCIMVQGKLR